MEPLYEYKHHASLGKLIGIVLLVAAIILPMLAYAVYDAVTEFDFGQFGQVLPTIMSAVFAVGAFPTARLRVYPDHIHISHGLFYLLKYKIDRDELYAVSHVKFDPNVPKEQWKEQQKVWTGWKKLYYEKKPDALLIASSLGRFVIGIDEPTEVLSMISAGLGVQATPSEQLDELFDKPYDALDSIEVNTESLNQPSWEPLFEFRNVSKARRLPAIIFAMVLLAIAIFLPVFPPLQDFFMGSVTPYIVSGVLVLLAIFLLFFIPESRLELYSDEIHLKYGTNALFKYRVPLKDVRFLEVVNNPLNDWRNAASQDKTSSPLHGLRAVLPYHTKHLLIIRTDKGGYYIACSDPEQVMDRLSHFFMPVTDEDAEEESYFLS